MPRIQLSRARRQVRKVKTASHLRDEASTGHKRSEGTAEVTDFDASSGWMQLRSLQSTGETTVSGVTVMWLEMNKFANITNIAGF